MNFIVLLNIDFMCHEGLLYIWMVEKVGKGYEKLNLFLVVKFYKLVGIINKASKPNPFQNNNYKNKFFHNCKTCFSKLAPFFLLIVGILRAYASVTVYVIYNVVLLLEITC